MITALAAMLGLVALWHIVWAVICILHPMGNAEDVNGHTLRVVLALGFLGLLVK